MLLPRVDFWILAALLYIGAGVGLAGLRTIQRLTGVPRRDTGNLRRQDVPLLLAIAVIGGGIGPVLMLIGLRTSLVSQAPCS